MTKMVHYIPSPAIRQAWERIGGWWCGDDREPRRMVSPYEGRICPRYMERKVEGGYAARDRAV